MASPPLGASDDALRIEQAHPTRTLSTAPLYRLLPELVADEGCRLADLSIVLTDHATVLALNRSYLDHDYHTDVLAFPLADEDGVVEGEVYVDLDTAAERCAEFGTSAEREAYRYVIHGVLHLCGHTDATAAGKATMHAREDAYLARLS